MSTSHSGTITVVAVVLLLATVPVLWGIADVREAQAVDRKQSDLVDSTVPTRQAPNDYDGDGIRDNADQCPTRAETTNGFQDSDGCPDVVETTGAS